jgi:hypothetical protein
METECVFLEGRKRVNNCSNYLYSKLLICWLPKHKRHNSTNSAFSSMAVFLAEAPSGPAFPCLLCRHFPLIYHIVPSSLPISIDDFLKLPLRSAAVRLRDGSCFQGDFRYLLAACSYYDDNDVYVCVLVLLKLCALIVSTEGGYWVPNNRVIVCPTWFPVSCRIMASVECRKLPGCIMTRNFRIERLCAVVKAPAPCRCLAIYRDIKLIIFWLWDLAHIPVSELICWCDRFVL